MDRRGSSGNLKNDPGITMKTITLDNGKKVTISEESYKALVDAATDKSIPIPENCGLNFLFGIRGTGILFRDKKSLLEAYAGFYDVSISKWPFSVSKAKLEPFDPNTQETEVGQVYVVNKGKFADDYYLQIAQGEYVRVIPCGKILTEWHVNHFNGRGPYSRIQWKVVPA